MKMIWIKSSTDKENFNFIKNIGFPVIEINDLEQTDNIIDSYIKKNYKTIIISNELAGFSTDIIKKYNKDDEINIIINSK